MARKKPVHYQHYKHAQYFHTYCGMINFAGYNPWSFTRVRKDVTCKRCKQALRKDERIVSFRHRIAVWAKRRAV